MRSNNTDIYSQLIAEMQLYITNTIADDQEINWTKQNETQYLKWKTEQRIQTFLYRPANKHVFAVEESIWPRFIRMIISQNEELSAHKQTLNIEQFTAFLYRAEIEIREKNRRGIRKFGRLFRCFDTKQLARSQKKSFIPDTCEPKQIEEYQEKMTQSTELIYVSDEEESCPDNHNNNPYDI